MCTNCGCESKAVKQGDNLMTPVFAEIIETKNLTEAEKYYKLKFKNGEELGHGPGQFVQVSVFGAGEAPISVSSSPTDKGYFELVVRKVGSLTEKLHTMQNGDFLGIRGPFGRPLPTEEIKGKNVLFVAGGIGLVPLRSLIRYVLHNRNDYKKVQILLGCRSPKDILFKEEIAEWKKRDDIEFIETVDQGDENWKGNCGVITTLFDKTEINPENSIAVIVGPPIMYKFVIQKLKELNFKDEDICMSLERRMKCGVGKCGHCQIGEHYCCEDGPTFYYNEVKDLKEEL